MIEHLFESHSRPSYCATCYTTFDSLIARDTHVSDQNCQESAPDALIGLSEWQKVELMELMETNCDYMDEKS
ncbi:hypothetical protein FOFC_13720 [Fusarium oxysporum]|nr:hypothetical protein FOFC_13720 [Fusarium oxysporum]